MIWYQGESEAIPDGAAVYTDRMIRFIDAVRSDTADPDLPVVIVQIARFINTEADSESWNLVQDLQRLLPGRVRNLLTVPAIDLDIDDLIHIGGEDQHRLGVRLAQAMAVLKRLPKAGKPPIELDKVTVEGPTVRIREETVLSSQRIPKEQYAKFSVFCRKVDALEEQKVLLQP
jgi:hypothetical protein